MPEHIEVLRESLAERYAVERELGHGATATVYLARDLRLPRRVALKVLHPELALAVRKERFQREIEIASRLIHPHILGVIESGAAGGLLYYVMPFLDGETLAERLAQQGRLPLTEALRVAREVADALDYAHRQGVIHRDIKPANILLSSGHAWVADFGIARAIAESDARVTDTGVRVGTPAYMSPEQASGSTGLDGGTDVYSLGVVLYEMLAGALPFSGPTVESVLVQQLMTQAPPLRAVCGEVPLGIERIVAQALAKSPSDRFTTAGEFAAALTRGEPAAPPDRSTRISARAVTPAGVLATLVALLASGDARGSGPRATAPGVTARLDTLSYVVLPLEPAAVRAPPLDQLLHDALAAWRGITVVDRFRVREFLAERDTAALSGREALEVSVAMGSGRYVRGEVAAIGDSLRIRAGVYDAVHGGTVLREGAVKVGRDLGDADAALAALVDRLLFGHQPLERWRAIERGTVSFPARHAVMRGLAAVERWDLPAADSAFAASAAFDVDFAQAHLWLAQVRFWDGAPPATWRASAERAAARRARLSPDEVALADALSDVGRGQLARACARWERLTRASAYEFAVWYGLATCLTRDDAVERDSRSPSGWRFRTSYHRALEAYQRAFQLLPAIHTGLRADAFGSVRRLLFTGGNEYRVGRAFPPDSGRFAAYPSWAGDTLEFVPYPDRDVRAGRPWTIPRRAALAIQRERERFHEICTAWAAAFPQSADALEALAISLELLGDPASLDTVRRAMALADPAIRRRIASTAVWMQLKFAIPSDVPAMIAARTLADSLLATTGAAAPDDALLLASLAAVSGRASRAAALSGQPGLQPRRDLPPTERASPLLAGSGRALLAFAALGGPPDSLDEMERRVASAIENVLPAPQRPAARLEWLARPATLAFPQHRLQSVTRLAGRGDYLLDAQAAFLQGDTATVRRILDDVGIARLRIAPADRTIDAVYPEAWLLAGLGEPQAAIAWLDPTLEALAGTAPRMFADPARAGALIRAIALRADLARQVGDHDTARRWARVVTILWSDADAFLTPMVRRMEQVER